ncbi:MAG: protoporphyrinogen oxidase HemJ [Rhodospirillales bacterium]|nr:protoporphyrinogen oxidase HemJ [Rhodospirillales bacterium]
MEGFLGAAYIWVKAFHIMAVVAWMAGMLYLPRLYAYHVGAAPGSKQSETFKVMERRLLRGIINPAMIVMFGLGIALMLNFGADLWSEGWWYVKLTALIAMAALHGAFSRWCRAFAEDRDTHSARFYKWWNEVPAVLMVIIVLMVVVKPF